MSEGSTARIAVVIPAYRQPQFLGAAISSALEQRCSVGVGVVVVNDGCPYESTERIALEARRSHPDRVEYLRQPNRGLSAARNAGIRHALATWPGLEAVFPLDADNRLSPRTLEQLREKLLDSDAAWASPRFEFIGGRRGGWQIPGPWSAYRQLFDNQSDAGSLIAREVFDRGIFYDEEMRDGYEDWELFVRAVREGLQGVTAGSCGFLYRARAHSMVARTKRRHEHAYAQITERHPDLFAARGLTAREHGEHPRYALVGVDGERVELSASLDLEPRRTSLGEFAQTLVRSRGGGLPSDLPIAPMAVLMTDESRSRLEESRLLAGILFRLQGELRDRRCVGLRFGGTAGGRIETVAGEAAGTSGVHGLAIRCADLYERLLAEDADPEQGLDPDAVVELSLPGPQAPPQRLLEPRVLARYRGEAPEQPGNRGEGPTHTRFFTSRHVDELQTTFPWTATPRESRRMVFLLLPRGDSGGMHRVALSVLGAMRELDPALSAHLVLTDGGEIDAATAALAQRFDSFTALGGTDPKLARDLLVRMLASADVVVNAHSQLGYELLPELDGNASQVSMLQTFEFDGFGLPTGYPMIAAREYEPLIDVFCVPSRRLARQLANLYVTPEKIVVGSNAPIVSPPSLEAARELARRKAARISEGGGTVRVLYAGRLDRQKGIERLEAIARRLDRGSDAVELTVVGEPMLDPVPARFPRSTELAGAVGDGAELARHYERADVFLLPSRWEGAPLALLDAMAFGCLVIATDVGAVPELVEHGHTGMLVDHRLPDDAIADRFVAAIKEAADAGDGNAPIRERACEQAMSLSWLDAARPLLAALGPTGAERDR